MKQAITAAAVLACLLAVVTLHQAYAEPQALIFGSSGLYSVHTAHVGDLITFHNDDTTNHTITGKATTGEIISSGTVKPGENFTFSIMFPAQFSFYDQYHQGNIGVFYIYNPQEAIPQNIYNHTSTADLLETPVYFADSAPVLAFGDSNATIVDFGISNATAPLETVPTLTQTTLSQATINDTNDTVAYWKTQAEMYKNKYDALLTALKLLLG